MKDLKLFYTNMLVGGTMYGWYEEKYINLMQRMVDEKYMQNGLLIYSSKKDEQFPDDQLDYNSDIQEQSNISNPVQQKLPQFAEIIRSFSHTLKSKIDKL